MIRINSRGLAAVIPLPTTRTVPNPSDDNDGPTTAELDAIEAEWPLIAAEIAVVEAEIALLCAPSGPTELDWRRLRRARARTLRQATTLAAAAAKPGSMTRRAA